MKALLIAFGIFGALIPEKDIPKPVEDEILKNAIKLTYKHQLNQRNNSSKKAEENPLSKAENVLFSTINSVLVAAIGKLDGKGSHVGFSISDEKNDEIVLFATYKYLRSTKR